MGISVVLLVSQIVSVDLLFIGVYVYTALLFLNSTILAFKYWQNSNTLSNKGTRNSFQHFYRAQQVLNKQGVNFSRELVAWALFTGSVLMILSGYCTLRLFEKVNILVLFILAIGGIITMTLIKMAIQLAGKVTESSEAYLLSMCNPSYGPLNKLKISFIRSCPPLYLYSGNYTKLSKETFKEILTSLWIP